MKLPFVGDKAMASLKHEIAQAQPFSSIEEEALLNVLLRILRGAQPSGLTCSGIGDRMIAAEPDITRLLSRLKALKLIKQQRDRHDRRVVWTQISQIGLDLLAQMDPVIERAPKELLGHLPEKDVVELIRLLELARQNCNDKQPRVSCTGKTGTDENTCNASAA
jgi:DNA-binding MarR family transcriptional regulator